MSTEKYVLLREKVLEMNSKSLGVVVLKSAGCSAGPCAAECSSRGSSCSSNCCMSSKSARASGDPWRKYEAIVFQ